MITPETLLKIYPNQSRENAEVVAQKLGWALPQYQIDTRLRVAHLLAQLAHESGFKPVSENLNYTARRMAEVWPSRYAVNPKGVPKVPNPLAVRLALAGPEAIANNVYAGRLGNGAPESGDGWAYRGRGMIQTTGRENYRTTGKQIGFDLEKDPDLLLQYGVSALAAAAFWKAHGLNRWADADDVTSVTRIINGGLNGLAERNVYLHRAKQALAL